MCPSVQPDAAHKIVSVAGGRFITKGLQIRHSALGQGGQPTFSHTDVRLHFDRGGYFRSCVVLCSGDTQRIKKLRFEETEWSILEQECNPLGGSVSEGPETFSVIHSSNSCQTLVLSCGCRGMFDVACGYFKSSTWHSSACETFDILLLSSALYLPALRQEMLVHPIFCCATGGVRPIPSLDSTDTSTVGLQP